MTLHCIPFHDDAIGAATSGWCQGGTALTAALVYNDDLIVDVDSNGNIPKLTDVIMHEFDVNGADAGSYAHWSLRPNTWPSTRTLTGHVTHVSSQATGPLDLVHPQETFIRGQFDIPLEPGLSWISSDSKVFATAANADIMLVLVYSYGTRYPYRGGHLQCVATTSATMVADTWTQAWSSSLQGVGFGLDPNKTYVLRGIVTNNDAVDEVHMGAMLKKQSGMHQMVGVGSGNALEAHTTWFMHDGIPCSGLDGWTALGLEGATGVPVIGGWFEEYP